MDENDFIEKVAALYTGRRAEHKTLLRKLAMKLERCACRRLAALRPRVSY